jgi:hypothetical protein
MIYLRISVPLEHRFVNTSERFRGHADLVFIFYFTQFSLFDVPLHYNFKAAGDQGNSFDMRSIWDGSVVQREPINAVTFVDNHEHVSTSLQPCMFEI